MTTGRRYGGTEAITAGIVESVESTGQVLPASIGIARSLAATSSPARGQIKQTLYAEALAALRVRTVAGTGSPAPAIPFPSPDLAE